MRGMLNLLLLGCVEDPTFSTGGTGPVGDDTGTPGDELGELLDFDISDVEYDETLDLLVAADQANLRVVLLDASGEAAALDMPLEPLCVSVSPDGGEAVIGMDGVLAVVDLALAQTLQLWDISVVPNDIVHGGNGYAYVFPNASGWTELHYVDLDDGDDEIPDEYMSVNERMKARLHPDGRAIYAADNGISPSDVERFDISAKEPAHDWDSPYHGDYSFSGDLWISDTGDFFIARSGNAFATNPDQDLDMVYEGSVPGPIAWAAFEQHLGLAVVADDEGALTSYETTWLGEGGAVASSLNARYFFFTEDGSTLRVVGQATNGQWGLDEVTLP